MQSGSPAGLHNSGPQLKVVLSLAELFPQVILERASGKGNIHFIINSIFVTALLGFLISYVKTTNEMTQLQSLIGIRGQ